MRKMLSAAMAGLVAAGGAAALAGGAQAQPYGYYSGRDNGYAYRYAPPRAYGYDGYYTPYSYPNGYDGSYGASGAAGLAGALLGSVFGDGYGREVPYDRYGADPNGMIAPDGHRIKCKLRQSYDGYYGRYVTRRECW